MDVTSISAIDGAGAQQTAGPVFAPVLSAVRVVAATRGREVASQPDKDLFFFAP